MATGANATHRHDPSPLAVCRRLVPRRTAQAGVLAACLLLHGCTSGVRAPVVSQDSRAQQRAGVSSAEGHSHTPAVRNRHGYHVVQKGDTLYSIAWRYGLDYRDLADWNRIAADYLIYPGQELRLTPPPARSRRQQRERPVAAPAPQRAAATPASVIKWQWPTRGRLLQADTPVSRKGVDIGGSAGQSIVAAAAGSVVYSGSGLLGYGKLIIIKHNDTYLSAYAHNQEIYVKEGDKVVGGQKIATMGIGNSGKPVLHFEIREKGKPVNPLSRLPKHHS